jgi:hypothetical protein
MNSTERLKAANKNLTHRMKTQQIAAAMDNLMCGNLTQSRKLAKGLAWGEIYDWLNYSVGWTEKKSAACADYLTKRTDFRAYCEAIR